MGNIKHSVSLDNIEMIRDGFYLEDFIRDRKDLLLTLLPKGTEYKGLGKNCGQPFSTYQVYDFVFEHPFIEDGSRIELEYRRSMKIVDEGTMHEKFLFADFITKVNYYKPDGEPLF